MNARGLTDRMCGVNSRGMCANLLIIVLARLHPFRVLLGMGCAFQNLGVITRRKASDTFREGFQE